MISITLAIVLGILFTFLATQNPSVVPVQFFGNAFSLPLYVIAAISFLSGILLALIFHLVDLTSASFDIRGRDNKLREFARSNQNLQNQMHRLEAENSRLKQQIGITRTELRDEQVEHRRENTRNFFGRVRQSLG